MVVFRRDLAAKIGNPAAKRFEGLARGARVLREGLKRQPAYADGATP